METFEAMHCMNMLSNCTVLTVDSHKSEWQQNAKPKGKGDVLTVTEIRQQVKHFLHAE